MTHTEDIIEGWFGDFSPENDNHKQLMKVFGDIFESYHNDDTLNMAIEMVLDFIGPQFPPDRIFSAETLSNKDMFTQIYEQLTGMELQPDPTLPKNARYQYKVAHILYPGNNLKDKRTEASKCIQDYLAEQRRSREARCSPATHPGP